MSQGGRARRAALRLLLAAAALCLASLVGLIVWASLLELPRGALDPRTIESTRIVAADGRLLREVLTRPDGRCRWVDLDRISPQLIQATLAGEDKRFLRHGGVDWIAMARAAVLNLNRGRVVSGGSTLSMQLVRLVAPPPPGDRRTLLNKLREMVLATKLERRLTKAQILWQYLNRAPYGSGTFGIEAAARRYLDKPAQQLSLAEAALLSALPRSPSGYAPHRHLQRLIRRQRRILALMRAQGRISADQFRRALSEPLAWQQAGRPFRAPHLTRHLLGLPQARGARRIETTIDLDLQRRVTTAVSRTVRRLRKNGVTNAAVLVLNNSDSAVLAYVGSVDFFDQRDAGQVDGTLALRQPGSALKPFTYAMALEQGLSPATVLDDLPVHFSTDQGDYHPRNYDDTFHGPVRLRVALGSSYNVPAVRTAEVVGVDRLLRRLRSGLRMRSLSEGSRHYGLGLTLGNGEVTLQALTAAYASLARGGLYLPPRFLRRVTRSDGSQHAPPAPTPRRVFGRRVSYLISHMLSDPLARVPAFGRDSVLDVGFTAAAKTGTSKDFRDNWTVGYTPQVTVGVWVGSFSGASMHNVSGISGAGPLWAEVIAAAQAGRPSQFRDPGGLVTRPICPLSGLLAGPHCPRQVEELFMAEAVPGTPCRWHRQIAIDDRNGLLAGPGCDARHIERRTMTVLPARYTRWAYSRGLPRPPAAYSEHCPPSAAARARITIRFPVSGDQYYVDPDLGRDYQRIPLEAQVSGRALPWLRWLVDGRPVATAPYPYSARWPIARGEHRVQAVLPGGERSQAVRITVH